jgi:hypothetical protein
MQRCPHLDSLHVERRCNHPAVARPLLSSDPHEPLSDELPGEQVVPAGPRLVKAPRGVGHDDLHELRVPFGANSTLSWRLRVLGGGKGRTDIIKSVWPRNSLTVLCHGSIVAKSRNRH